LAAKAVWVKSAAAQTNDNARSAKRRSEFGIHASACAVLEDSLKAGHQTEGIRCIDSQVRLVTSAATGEFNEHVVFIVLFSLVFGFFLVLMCRDRSCGTVARRKRGGVNRF
jgi:hypothetical protein